MPETTEALTEEREFVVHGSGNVFRDFGDPEADRKQAKAVLAARIIAVLDDRGLAARKAASLTGFAAADFSRIRNADLGRFTLDRLMKMLAALGARVTVRAALSRSLFVVGTVDASCPQDGTQARTVPSSAAAASPE